MMERFFYDKCGTVELYEALKSDPVFPLVRELNFKYKLKVLAKVKTSLADSTHAYQLVNHMGLATAAVSTSNTGGKTENCLEYRYTSPYYLKQRGDSRLDKQTIRSVKVSSLMATLSRQNVVPNDLMLRKTRLVENALRELRSSLGKDYKAHSLTPDEVQALLAHYLGVNTDKEVVDLDLNKCKMELDNMVQADEVRKLKVKEADRFFADGYYQFGIDEFGHLVVGKFKFKSIDYKNSEHVIDCIEPLKRYVNPSDYTELAPLMTMIKLAYEDTKRTRAAHGIPIHDGYDKALDMVFYHASQPTRYDFQWMFTPIGGGV